MAGNQADPRNVVTGAGAASFRIEPYLSPEDAARARDFNQRLRLHHRTEFLLAEEPPQPDARDAAIRHRYYLVHEADSVRGGFLLAAFPAAFADGRNTVALNAREPLSEAVIEPKYGLLALRMLKFMERQGPHLFALGMGGESRPFPRLLKSARWTLSQVPFLFRVVRANRFLQQMPVLRTSPARRMLASAAALTGTGKAAFLAMQYRAGIAALRRGPYSVEPLRAWDTWVDDLWPAFRRDCSFAVARDLKTVRELYPFDDGDRAYLVRYEGRPAGWMSARISRMHHHKHFGSLCVATLLDGVGLDHAMQASVSLVSNALAREGADLLVTNQSHARWIAAFRQAGYLPGPSNYILALSKQLATDIAGQPGGFAGMHFTRGDSDGRCHL